MKKPIQNFLWVKLKNILLRLMVNPIVCLQCVDFSISKND